MKISILLLIPTLCFSQSIKQLFPTLGEIRDISPRAQAEFARMSAIQKKLDSLGSSYQPTPEEDKILSNEMYGDVWETVGGGCSWYCGGGPENIAASSFLPSKDSITYAAKNGHDFSLKTAWIEGSSGYGIGHYIEFTFANKSPRVTKAIIYNGYQKSERSWKDNSRVKKFRLIVNGLPYAILNLADTRANQTFDIGTQGHRSDGKDLVLRFEILEVCKGSRFSDVAISEINFDGLDVHCIGAGTAIRTRSNTTKLVEQLLPKDTILSYNTNTSKYSTTTIKSVTKRLHSEISKLSFDAQSIIVSREHPIWIIGKGFLNCDTSARAHVSVGDSILTLKGEQLVPNRVCSISSLNEATLLYEIILDDDSNAIIANDLLVGFENHFQSNHFSIAAPNHFKKERVPSKAGFHPARTQRDASHAQKTFNQ